MRRGLAGVAALAGVHVLPAATWLPAVRRLVPPLESPMPAGTVAVTFDDGPSPRGTPAVLDALEELGWSATFFMLGSAVERHPELAREVAARGHTVAVHGHDHRYLIGRGPAATWQDLAGAKATVERAAGAPVRWWRPPYGVLSAAGVAASTRLGVRPLLWSAWGKDWRDDATPDGIVRTVLRGRVDGGVVLLHDSDATSAPQSWQRTAAALPLLAAALETRQVRVAPLPEAPPR